MLKKGGEFQIYRNLNWTGVVPTSSARIRLEECHGPKSEQFTQRLKPENTFFEIAGKGAAALIRLIPTEPACTPLFKALIRCGNALDLITAGNTEGGFRELGQASGALFRARAEGLNRDSLQTEGSFLGHLDGVRQALGDCILACVQYRLRSEPRDIARAGECLQFGVVAAAAAAGQQPFSLS